MMINNWPLREIVARHYYRLKGARVGEGRSELTLSCGHLEFRKRSMEPTLRARCWACYVDGLDCAKLEQEQK